MGPRTSAGVTDGMALCGALEGMPRHPLTAALGLLELGLGAARGDRSARGDPAHRRPAGCSQAGVMITPDLIEGMRAGRRDDASRCWRRFEARGARRARAGAGSHRPAARADDSTRSSTPRWRCRIAADAARCAQHPAQSTKDGAAHANGPTPRPRRRPETFERLGARGWAERTAPSRRPAIADAWSGDRRTAHPRAPDRGARGPGTTNREAAAALFSPKMTSTTSQIYRKLDVRGRAQLARLMAMEMPEGERTGGARRARPTRPVRRIRASSWRPSASSAAGTPYSGAGGRSRYLDDHHGDEIVGIVFRLPRQRGRIAASPERFYMPSYIDHRGWAGLRLDTGPVDWTEVADFVTDSYIAVAPKRLAAQLEA